MREGNLEILVKVGGVVLKETKVDGKTYAAAEAGREFTVEVRVYGDNYGEHPFSYGGVCFHVDGKSTYNANLLHLHRDRNLPFVSTSFIGYNYGSNAFTFGDLKSASQVDSKPSAVGVGVKGLGTMTAYLYEMKPTISPPVSTTKYQAVDSAKLSSSDNKKFWEAPSLTTVPGRQMASKPNIQPFGYVDQSRPHSRVTLHYHSKEMIRCLQTIHAQNTATDDEEEKEETEEKDSSTTSSDANKKRKGDTSGSAFDAIKHESLKKDTNESSSSFSSSNGAVGNTDENGVIQIIDSDDDQEEKTTNIKKQRTRSEEVVNLCPERGYAKQHDGSVVDLT
jgi:hypothetical protein